MTRTMLIATVAAFAVTAPAQADRGDRDQRAERAQKAQDNRGGQRAKASERRAGRAERPRAQRQRAERPRQRAERPQRKRLERQRAERPERQRVERPQRQRVERQRAERPERQRVERQRVERPQRQRVVERRATAPRAEKRVREIRREARRDRRDERIATIQQRPRSITPERFAERREARREVWQGFAQRRAARIEDNRSDRRDARRVVRVGQLFDGDRDRDRVPFVYRARYQDTPSYYYRYDDDDGYLYRVRRDNNFVSALFPLLGGAYSVGRPLSYDSYNVPYGYRSLYYDTPDYYYRYGGGAIYRVDAGTQIIQAIVALLTGQNFGVGQVMPASYSTYNVPYDYRDRYYDTADSWYRYNDGNIYQIDPRTRVIEQMYPINHGFAIGSPLPYGYANYNVPYGYRDVYYDTPDYNYRYASGGIYRVDPTTQMVQALVALATGQNYNVGQVMPASYSVYNVPYGYRDRYYDTADSWYRYNDGTIYELDPRTRLIRTVIHA